jgi:predicted transcriptional regulator
VNSSSYYNGSYCFGSVRAVKADSYIVFISKHRCNGDNIVNRSREEILADMLSVAIEPVNKTAIMYKAKLSYEQLKDYLSYMVDRQMIETTKEGTWATTEKGKTYLASYQLIVRIIA